MNIILSSGKPESNENSIKIKELYGLIDTWNGDEETKKRAKGLLSMLNTPSPSKNMDILIRQGVINEIHKQIWNKARPYLAHGGIVDFTKYEEFWHYRNYLISMAYRLTFRILRFKGTVIDYDGEKFDYPD
jgi:hypothetical protein